MIDISELKTALSVPESDESLDELLEALERSAVAFVETQTGRYFGDEAEMVTVLPGTGTDRLWLPEKVTEFGAIEVTEYKYVGDTGSVIDADDDDGYVVRGLKLVRKKRGTWDKCYEYGITFDRGYATGEEPADIRQLVIDLVARKFNQRGKEGFRSEDYGGYSYSYDDGDVTAIAGARETIDAYRRVRV